jgi:hypothetical protein
MVDWTIDMHNILAEIEEAITAGVLIPKPRARSDFIVKGWGMRRGEQALIHTIPNHKNPTKPHTKGITRSEWDHSFGQLSNAGELTRSWFNQNLPACAKEGACNFTTIGGIFELLGHAKYEGRGGYRLIRRRRSSIRGAESGR